VRAVRANGNLTAYLSADGVAWQQMGNTVSVALSGTVYAGLAVTSQDNTKLNTAVFDHVSITGPDAMSGTADFLIAASSAAQTVAAGGSSASTAQIAAKNGFTGVVNLSVTGLPAGASAVFSPASVSGGGNAALTISAAASTVPGTYSLNLAGASGALTRIVPFTLVVSAAQPTFSLAATPASQSSIAGGSAAYTVTVTPQNGFTSAVSLSVSGLPAGAAATFSGSSTLTVNTSASTPIGSYTLTITAAGGGITKTAAVTLVVTAPAAPDFSLPAAPAARNVQAGFGTTYAIGTAALNGATGGVTLSVAGLPASASAWFNPALVTLGAGSVLTVNTSSATPAGTYNLTVTGTSGTLTHPVALTLTVTAPADGINLDIGTPGLAGSGGLSAGTFTVKGSGADIWGTSDQFHFDYWTLPGDGTITARVVSVTNTSFYAKAGVMMRQSLNANAPYAFAAALPSLSVFQYRTGAGDSASSSGYYAAAYPAWVRVVRANGNLTAYASADGAAWRQMGNTVSVGLIGTVYAGLAVSAQDNTKLNTAVFDNVSVTGPDAASGIADFLLGAVGGSGAWTVQITPENGFTGVVNLSVSGLPSGATAVFSPASLTGGGSAALTISAAAGTVPGTYSPSVVGASGTKTRIVPIALVIK
jgi:uncharacterized protein YdeI (BOF family)